MSALHPPPYAAASCEALSTTAGKLASTIIGHSGPESSIEHAVQVQQARFLPRLREFRQHTDQLGSCFAEAKAIHPDLGNVLQSAVSQCHDSIVGFPVSITAAQAADFFTRYEALVDTHVRLFILGTQLLIMGSAPDQQSMMASPAARAIVDAAVAASRAAFAFGAQPAE